MHPLPVDSHGLHGVPQPGRVAQLFLGCVGLGLYSAIFKILAVNHLYAIFGAGPRKDGRAASTDLKTQIIWTLQDGLLIPAQALVVRNGNDGPMGTSSESRMASMRLDKRFWRSDSLHPANSPFR